MYPSVSHTHYGLLLPDFNFSEVGPEDYNYLYENRLNEEEVDCALSQFNRLKHKGVDIFEGDDFLITEDSIRKGEYILPLDKMAEELGSRNEVFGEIDKMFDGYLIATKGLFTDYTPDEAVEEYDKHVKVPFQEAKAIMQEAAKALDDGNIEYGIMPWDTVKQVFNEDFINHWAQGTAYSYDDGKAPKEFNLGLNEQITILNWLTV